MGLDLNIPQDNPSSCPKIRSRFGGWLQIKLHYSSLYESGTTVAEARGVNSEKWTILTTPW